MLDGKIKLLRSYLYSILLLKSNSKTNENSGGDLLPAYKTKKEFEEHIKTSMNMALKNTTNVLTNKLMEFIDIDFYQKYSPLKYSRTDQLKDSPKFHMLSESIVEILIDTDSMNYKYATGDYVALLASKGFHGNEYIFRKGYYWDDFISYCENNVVNIYKHELQKQGFNIS